MDESSSVLFKSTTASGSFAAPAGGMEIAQTSPDFAPVGLIVTTPAGNIISFNQAIQDMLDIRLEDYVNTNVCDLYANPDARRHLLD